jgi:hypothetical protein
MSKRKKFVHHVPRPSLAASLEAVRQGQTLTADTRKIKEPSPQPATFKAPVASQPVSEEVKYVKGEVVRIGIIASLLLLFLLILVFGESKTQLLTRTVDRLIGLGI